MKNTTIIKQSGFFSSHPEALFHAFSMLPESSGKCHFEHGLSSSNVDVIGLALGKYDNRDLTCII